MLKHQNRDNASDLFLIFEAAGAEIHIRMLFITISICYSTTFL